jgi:RimJ/RimL family protein N-acetyltransferase
MNFEIRKIGPLELTEYVAHLDRHMPESGVNGSLPFAPFASGEWNSRELREALPKRWAATLRDPMWERVWAAFDGAKIIGHIDLRGPHLKTMLHRARLGMGIEQPYRGQGLGSRLIETALKWARGEKSLDWVELQVFAHNEAGLKLYQSHGFKEVGRMEDSFRVSGRKIEDLFMTLKLR